MTSGGRRGHGLIGYGITMYEPPCAFACRDTISSSVLNCSMEDMEMDGMDMGGGGTEPECYATDDTFLQTMAWCISTHCQDVTAWKLEKYWRMNIAGRAAVQPDPKYTYQQALSRVTEPPTDVLVSGDPLNKTSLVDEDAYTANYNADINFEAQENTHERYGYVVVGPSAESKSWTSIKVAGPVENSDTLPRATKQCNTANKITGLSFSSPVSSYR
jgi:hypothetical protein